MRKTTIVFVVIVGVAAVSALVARFGPGKVTPVTGLIGSLTGAEKLLGAAAYDLAWFSHGKCLDLLSQDRNLVVTQEEIMLSPVVLGVKESVARRLGWSITSGDGGNPNVTGQDIAAAAQDGKLRFAMTNPATSNSGFTALVGVATALTASGHTAIYSALAEAYRLAAAAQAGEPDRYYSVVLMSDGVSYSGISAEQFRRFYANFSPAARGIRTFTVVFGQADRATMEQIATITGGRTFDGTKDPLDFIFKQIRGYQSWPSTHAWRSPT